jgi:hypothetical protein
LNQAIRLIADTAKRRDLSGDEGKALLRVVGEYSHALDLLDDYDRARGEVGPKKQLEMTETRPKMPIKRSLRRAF